MREDADSGRLLSGGPGLLGTHIPFYTGDNEMLDYLRIMINARLAKMDERGASAVEYGLLVAGIAAVIVGIVFILGGNLKSAFDTTNSSIETKTN